MKNNPFAAIKSLFAPKKKAIDLAGVYEPGWRPLGISGTYGYYKENHYENGYSSIRAIANAFVSIRPYAIDAQGNRVESKIIDLLYNPNTSMSGAEFREALAVMSLVHPKVYVLVWKKVRGGVSEGGPVSRDTLAGFTILEGVVEEQIGNTVNYRVGTKTYTSDDVLVLKGINPYNLDAGYSPAQAAHRWTRLDDYIADYETGFFENGAVPAGQFVIKAKTRKDFDNIVDDMQKKHRGARANNNVGYVHEPFNPGTGETAGAQITWIPFSNGNNKLELDSIYKNVNRKIDSVYGVPASIRGDNSNNTYASVRVDEVIMAKWTVKPFTSKMWDNYNSELNRVLTDGTGIAIVFDYEAPMVAEEEKVLAEKKQVEANLIITMTTAGYSLENVIKAFDLSEKYEALEEGSDDEEETNPDVDDNAPSDDITEVDIQESEGQLLAPIDVPKAVTPKQFSQNARQQYESQLANVVRNRMRIQINNAITNLDLSPKAISENRPIEPVEDELLRDEMLGVLIAAIFTQGPVDQVENLALLLEAGINTDGVPPFHMTEAQRRQYQEYVSRVATSYNAETAERIRNILRQARDGGFTAQQTRDALNGIVREEWRIQRIAVTEINRAGNESSLVSMTNIAEETGAEIEKVWEHSGSDAPCQFCQATIGRSVPLRESFVPVGSDVVGTEGGVLVNDFVSMQVGGMHPNCHCRQTYRVIRR